MLVSTRARNVSFLGALLSMSCGGTLYLFSAYAPTLGYSPTETSLIASAGGAGMYLLGPVAGKIGEILGGRRLAFLSAVFLGCGYLLLAFTVRWQTPFALAAFAYFFVGLGSCTSYNAAVSTILRTFAVQQHGVTVGLLASAFGLSGFLFSQVSKVFVTSEGELQTFRFLLSVGIVTAAANLVASLTLAHPSATYVSLPSAAEGLEADERERLNEVEDDHAAASALAFDQPNPFKTTEMWVFLAAFMILTGSGLMYINSVGTILATAGMLPKARIHVSVLSISNALGRFVTGTCSDWTRPRVPRLSYLLLSSAMFGPAFIYAASFVPSVFTTATVGFAYGTLFVIAPVFVGELGGVAKFGWNWGWAQWAPAIGGQFFNTLFGVIMDRHSRRDSSNERERLPCQGTVCYATTFYIAAAATTFAGVLIAGLVAKRLRRTALSGYRPF
ncbi:hypothetical protein HDU88_003310 [Geranomyces variabilis]|nr:hypothetical protein HDU88_003310 [Geranomyces variabilis]